MYSKSYRILDYSILDNGLICYLMCEMICSLCLTIPFEFSNPSFQYWHRLNNYVIAISKLVVNVFTSLEIDTLNKVYFFLYQNLDQ